MAKIKKYTEFEQVVILIEEARNRAFSKVNAELVLLYFNVGNIVSDKVAAGVWGENTVDDLANFIEQQYPGLKGFNRRGLYRMKQFFEAYTALEFVSPLATQLQKTEKETLKFVTTPVTQLSWTHHLLILSKTKTVEEKLFYIHAGIKSLLRFYFLQAKRQKPLLNWVVLILLTIELLVCI